MVDINDKTQEQKKQKKNIEKNTFLILNVSEVW